MTTRSQKVEHYWCSPRWPSPWEPLEGLLRECHPKECLFFFHLTVRQCFAFWSSSNTLNVFLSVSSLMALERSGLNTVIMTQITSTQGFLMFGQLHKICPLLMLWPYTTRNHQQKDNRAMPDRNNQHLYLLTVMFMDFLSCWYMHMHPCATEIPFKS